MKHSVKLTSKKGTVTYLSHLGRMSWSKRTALKHIKDLKGLYQYDGFLIELEESI